MAAFLQEDEPWMMQAACRGHPNPDIWFPERGGSKASNIAKSICFDCPVRKQCADYDQRTGNSEGIWAGKTHKRREE